MVGGSGISMERAYGLEVMQFLTVGFELEEVVRYIKDQNKRNQQEGEGDF
jgi:hypothetical protein